MTIADRCPGALSLHEAADGRLARIRIPGGFVSGAALSGLADLTNTFGDGRLELTSRGNVQVRAISADDADRVADAVAALGLLPSPTHERVRNIIASPIAGLDGSGSLREVVRALDAAICADPHLATLSGRFLFGVDAGGGDVLAERPDVCIVRGKPWRLTIGDTTINAAAATAVDLAVAAAREFLRATSGQWRIRDVAGLDAAIAAAIGRPGNPIVGIAPVPVGVFAQPDGSSTVIVGPHLGRLTAPAAYLLVEHAVGELRVTPWRSVVVPGVVDVERLLEAAARQALSVRADDGWAGVTSCAGKPGCAQALQDVQSDAARAVCGESDLLPGVSGRIHWSGCERRCGHPSGAHTEVLATRGGYAVSAA